MFAPREGAAALSTTYATHTTQAIEPLRWQLEGAAYTQWRAACKQAGVTEQRALIALLALALGTRFDSRDVTLGLALRAVFPADLAGDERLVRALQSAYAHWLAPANSSCP